jgi:RimJ/RimL family protein N-acetyltransferase
VRSTPVGDPWALSYKAVERATGAVVGGCAFKGPPDAFGVVELAYSIDPPHRGRGFATEMAGALMGFALASARVRMVRAHTKPDNAASARVLEKCGFRPVGEVIDPKGGPVCRWEYPAYQITAGEDIDPNSPSAPVFTPSPRR